MTRKREHVDYLRDILDASEKAERFVAGMDFRQFGNDNPYRCTTGLVGLAEVANAERPVPREWINERGNFVADDFIRYVRPLIQGEVAVPIENGLPKYVRLRRKPIPKKCPGR